MTPVLSSMAVVLFVLYMLRRRARLEPKTTVIVDLRSNCHLRGTMLKTFVMRRGRARHGRMRRPGTGAPDRTARTNPGNGAAATS